MGTKDWERQFDNYERDLSIQEKQQKLGIESAAAMRHAASSGWAGIFKEHESIDKLRIQASKAGLASSDVEAFRELQQLSFSAAMQSVGDVRETLGKMVVIIDAHNICRNTILAGPHEECKTCWNEAYVCPVRHPKNPNG